MTLHSLPIFVRLQGRAVILVGVGETAEAKRRLLERSGAVVVGEDGICLPTTAPARHTPPPLVPSEVEGHGTIDNASTALAPNGRGNPQLAIVVDDDEAVARLKARGVLVNAVDRPELCDFTLPAIVDRNPVLVAIGTGGASAGLAAALRQRLETLLPTTLGPLADALFAARAAWRARFPDATERRQAISAALAPGGAYDPLRAIVGTVTALPPADDQRGEAGASWASILLTSPDPDDLTLRQARLLANADHVTHGADVPAAVLNRARADADRICCASPPPGLPGSTIDVRMA